MSTPSGFLRGSRALFEAARSAASVSSAKKPVNTAAAAGSGSVSKNKKTANPTTGIMRSAPVSPALQSFVGAPEISRAEAVKKIWEYIKHNNLQNPSNKREIFCDAKLKKLFDGKDKLVFFEVTKLLSPHFLKAN